MGGIRSQAVVASPGPCDGTLKALAALCPGQRPFTLRTPLETDECRWFDAAIEQGLVVFRECDPACSRLKQRGASGPDEFVTTAAVPRHLFASPEAPEPALNREYITDIAAYAR